MKLFQSEGYVVEFGREREGETTHAFCGAQDIPGAICPGCRRPFLRFLAINTADPRLAFDRGTSPGHLRTPAGEKRLFFLHLLYCWRCCDSLSYRLNPYNGIDLLDFGAYRPKPEGDDVPYEDYPEHFPKREIRLRKLPAEAQELIRRANRDRLTDKDSRGDAWLTPRHQLGGEARFMQGAPDEPGAVCPLCDEEMLFFATVGDDSGTIQGFMDNEFAHVVYFFCPRCRVVSAHDECD